MDFDPNSDQAKLVRKNLDAIFSEMNSKKATPVEVLAVHMAALEAMVDSTFQRIFRMFDKIAEHFQEEKK